MVLELGDAGWGMPVNLQGATVEQLGVGITGMRERVRQFGSRLEILPEKHRRALGVCSRQPGVQNRESQDNAGFDSYR